MGKASLLTPRPNRLRIGPEINRGAYGTVYLGTLGARAHFTNKEPYSPSVCQVATQDPPSCGLVIREGQPQIDRRAADLAKHYITPCVIAI